VDYSADYIGAARRRKQGIVEAWRPAMNSAIAKNIRVMPEGSGIVASVNLITKTSRPPW
jgi:hypothetical protein